MSEVKTFTQDEVNAIVSERLKQERAKIMKDVQTKEAELNRRETMMNTRADWQKRGLPVELLDCLDAEKLEAAAAILENNKDKPVERGGWGGGKNPREPSGAKPLRDQNGNLTDYAIRQKMGLSGKDE